MIPLGIEYLFTTRFEFNNPLKVKYKFIDFFKGKKKQ